MKLNQKNKKKTNTIIKKQQQQQKQNTNFQQQSHTWIKKQTTLMLENICSFTVQCLSIQAQTVEIRPMTPYIFRIRSPGERHEHVYMATPLSIFKKNQRWYFLQEKKNGATDLKLGMQTQLDFTNNTGWVHPATPLPPSVQG